MKFCGSVTVTAACSARAEVEIANAFQSFCFVEMNVTEKFAVGVVEWNRRFDRHQGHTVEMESRPDLSPEAFPDEELTLFGKGR